ncbi:MAG: GGDEF domain-containing protein [Lachnospiraceae bacterium]|nr:GGDEF domain-containing protein [Lachnospiraceae bacterium]
MAKAGEKKKKAFLNQWIILFFLFVTLSGITLMRFATVTSSLEETEVETCLQDTVTGYASEMGDVLTGMRVLGDTVGQMVENLEDGEKERAYSALSALTNGSSGYMTVLCDTSGKGICQAKGENTVKSIQISETDYFGQLRTLGNGFILVKDDGTLGKSAVVCVSVIEIDRKIEGFLLQYYDVGQFRNIVKRADFDTDTKIYLLDSSGVIMAYSGKDENYENHIGENLWTSLKSRETKNGQIAELQYIAKNQNRSLKYVDLTDASKVYLTARVGIGDWSVVTELDKSYVDKQIGQGLEDNGNMLTQMTLWLILFAGAVLVLNTISMRKDGEDKAELEAKADTDLLTDLYNKAATERKIREYIEEHPQDQALLFVLDIDNFKKINDTMGHAFGDEVLRTVGTTIRTEFRVSDIVGRTGGDEFTIFLKFVQEEDEIRKQVERILRFFTNLQVGEYVKYSPNASIGAAVFPRDAKDFESLYKAADQALYVAKNRGKNQLAFYGDDK